ncbi:transglycosylase SLT domain-containing protein [Psychromarinibacter sp. C21-152]|uniref:Transglycosylase SLT domain-containing protein n=1 Tax=Psychromarinibacter sediminicola TaxID=3033385 RepID=A0AAE3NL32_9RHOB|nr:transglycosylase SLT domain-containing protein [Psychromarinibacter sediminicola]MDF0599898.1 transglycosylase SLT domain-containing protein [Psychromarinibacter sediminicola]
MLKSAFWAAVVAAAFSAAGCASKPAPDTAQVPPMRWDFRPEAREWTLSTMNALETHGAVLPTLTPSDIDEWCPAYRTAPVDQRKAFWAGLFSALAKHESRWTPDASGGGGRWLGLLQIAPATARGVGCRAQTAAALFDGSANLSCGVRLAAHEMPRKNRILGGPGRWGGVAQHWAPFRYPDKVADMRNWLRAQPYCAAK